MIPSLPCPACGTMAFPHLEPGTGPHVAKAVCVHCGHFIKWVPRALVRIEEKEKLRMVASVNRVVLLGIISTYGTEVRYTTTGMPCTSFTLVVSETGQDGKTHDVYVPCECWGKKAEAASELDAGQLVLFEGKLRKRQKGEQWEMIVSGFEAQPVLTATMVTEASTT